MFRAFESELIKLRRRSMTWGVIGPLAAFSFIATVFAFSVAEQAGELQQMLPNAPNAVLLDAEALSRVDGLARVLAESAVFGGVVVAAVFAATFATEFSLGTIRVLLVHEPRRARLLLGKFLGVIDLLFVGRLVAVGVSILAAVRLAPMNDVSTSAWFTSAGWATLGLATVNILLATVGWAALGTLAAIVFKSPAAAVGVVLAYSLPFESLLVAYWSGAPRWLPGQLIYAVGSGGTASSPYGRSLALMLAYALIAISLSIMLLRRSDVTA